MSEHEGQEKKETHHHVRDPRKDYLFRFEDLRVYYKNGHLNEHATRVKQDEFYARRGERYIEKHGFPAGTREVVPGPDNRQSRRRAELKAIKDQEKADAKARRSFREIYVEKM